MKYAFIRDELAGASTVRKACRLLEVSHGGHYRLLKAPVAARKARRLEVADHAGAWNTGEIRKEMAPDDDAERPWPRCLAGPAR